MTKSEGEKKELVPKLRFPEFVGEPGWVQSKIGKESSILKGKGISKSDIDPNGFQPCIRYGEMYTRYDEIIEVVVSRTNVSADELFFSMANDVIIPSSGETKLDIAKASCVLLERIALGSDLNVIRTKLHGPFLSYYINGPKKLDIAKVAQGDTVVHLYPSQLEDIDINFPSPFEQRKIAECLSSLDNLIQAENQKLDALNALRKRLIQDLFPREGETSPRRRFPEFRKARSWSKRKVSNVLMKEVIPVEVESENLYQEIGIRSHGKGLFHKAPITGRTLGEKRVFEVIENAFVLNIVFAWEQAVATTSREEVGMIASHRFPMYVPRSEGCDVRFIKYLFLTPWGKHLLGLASPGGAGRNRTLGQTEFEKLDITLPDKDEQTKIANLIRAAEDRISIQTLRIDTLNTHKKGLMQQFFPVLEESEP